MGRREKILGPLYNSFARDGHLYEYDRNSKPSWKKHIWTEGTAQNTSLIPSTGCPLHGLSGAHSVSLFLLAKGEGGNLVERRLHQRKWKWIVHGSPQDHLLSSITPVSQDELNEKTSSLFLSTASGTVFEYRLAKHAGSAQDNQIQENWVSHMHPPLAKVARGVSGQQFQVGRIIFPLDDGRLAELHVPGLGGETVGPTYPINVRRKASFKYVWSILDAPESEGWNAEYCTEERGPSNCIMGIKDELNDAEITRSRGRKGSKAQQNYFSPDASEDFAAGFEKSEEEINDFNRNCDSKVAPIRPIPFTEDSVIFELKDGRLAEMQQREDIGWVWLRIIGTPTSLCIAHFWTGLAS